MYTPLCVLLVILSSFSLLHVICGYLNCMYLSLLIFKHVRLNPSHIGKTVPDFQKEQYKSLKNKYCLACLNLKVLYSAICHCLKEALQRVHCLFNL